MNESFITRRSSAPRRWSGPVSRILCTSPRTPMIISLLQQLLVAWSWALPPITATNPNADRAGFASQTEVCCARVLLGFAPDGGYLARRVAASPVRSYFKARRLAPFHPYSSLRQSGLFSVALSRLPDFSVRGRG